jgi:hypothetical protein
VWLGEISQSQHERRSHDDAKVKRAISALSGSRTRSNNSTYLKMDRTLPEYDAITVPVPEVLLATEDKFKDYSFVDITHVVFR